MLETILSAMTAHLKDILAQNPVTTRFSNDNDVKRLSDSLQDVFKQAARSGNRDIIKNLFNGEDKNLSSPVMAAFCKQTATSMEAKGMSTEDAELLCQNALPAIFNMYNAQIAEARTKGIDIPQILDDVLSGKFNYSDMGKLMSLAGIFMKGNKSLLGKFF